MNKSLKKKLGRIVGRILRSLDTDFYDKRWMTERRRRLVYSLGWCTTRGHKEVLFATLLLEINLRYTRTFPSVAEGVTWPRLRGFDPGETSRSWRARTKTSLFTYTHAYRKRI